MTTTLERIKASAADLKSPDPVKRAKAEAIKRRYQEGLFNAELSAEGAQPVPIKKPNFEFVDLKKATEGMSDAPQSTPPAKPITADMGQDIGQMYDGLGETVGGMVEGVKDIATDPDYNIAQKGMGILGKLAGGVSSVAGELITATGKAMLTQDAEDRIKGIVQGAGQGIAETETAKKLMDWYGELDKDDKLFVDSLGGAAALITDVFVAGSVKPVAEATQIGLKTGLNTLEEGGGAIINKVDDIFTTSQKTLESKVSSAFEKGVKPNLQGQQTLGQAEKYRSDVIEAVKVIERNKDSLRFTNDLGDTITGQSPKSLQEFSDAIEQTKKKVYESYDDLATKAGENGLTIDTIKIANELDQVINNKGLQLSNPEAVRYAEEVRERFIKAGTLDAKTAQEIIQNYNNSLKAFYRNPTPEGLTKNAVDALMANQMRQALDEGIEGLTGAQYQSLKNQYSALKTIERDVLRATLRDARKNTKGLIDYTDIFSGGQLVTGLLTLNPSIVASGVAQKSIASYFKFLNDPNRAIEKMFESGAKLNQEPGAIPISTRKQLNAPAEGASNVSIETPIRLGERSQSTIDATEANNPNIGTTAKGYQSRGNLEIKEEPSQGSIEVEVGSGLNPEKLPVINFGGKNTKTVLTVSAGLAGFYTINENGNLSPLVAVGMLSPNGRKLAIKFLREHIDSIEMKASTVKDKAVLKKMQTAIDEAKREIQKLSD